MYCKNCGKELTEKDNFCSACGTPNEYKQVLEQANQTVVTKEKKKGKGWIIALCVGIPLLLIALIVIFIVVVFGFVFSTLRNEQREEYIFLDSYSIPTIYYYVGERKLCGFETNSTWNSTEKTYTYCDNDIDSYDYEEYIEKLQDYFGYNKYRDYYGEIGLYKYVDNDYVITIEIDIDDNEITYTLEDSYKFSPVYYDY